MPPRETDWRQEITNWARSRTRRPKLFPYLSVTRAPIGSGPPETVSCLVKNDGLAPATSCYVQFFVGPWDWFGPLAAWELCEQRITTVQAAQEKLVTVPWPDVPEGRRIIAVVFEPMLDARDFETVAPMNRKISSVHLED